MEVLKIWACLALAGTVTPTALGQSLPEAARDGGISYFSGASFWQTYCGKSGSGGEMCRYRDADGFHAPDGRYDDRLLDLFVFPDGSYSIDVVEADCAAGTQLAEKYSYDADGRFVPKRSFTGLSGSLDGTDFCDKGRHRLDDVLR